MCDQQWPDCPGPFNKRDTQPNVLCCLFALEKNLTCTCTADQQGKSKNSNEGGLGLHRGKVSKQLGEYIFHIES